jgi:hypothetical protein
MGRHLRGFLAIVSLWAVSQTFGAVPLATGPTVYVGPMIGLQFGR